MTLKVIELFSGIGATHQAIKELGIKTDIVGISEIDKKAIAAYETIHGPVKNYGDITKIDTLDYADLVSYTWPCQSVSLLGKQNGMIEGSGTTSSLLWEVGRILKNSKELPKTLIAENVDAVINSNNYSEFKRWINFLSDLGYTSSYSVLNAKDYGTPQNRKRLFIVSSLNNDFFIFPESNPNDVKLIDLFEKHWDSSIYMSDKRLRKLGVKNSSYLWPCGSKDYVPIEYGDGLKALPNPKCIGTYGTVQKEKSPTINTHNGGGAATIDEDGKYRYLTPKETLRLQCFPDSAINKLCGFSKTTLYKFAGNTIPVCVLKAIFKGIYIDRTFTKASRQLSLSKWGVA